MTVQLTSNFFANARGLTLADANGISWGINKNTNQITAAYTGSGSAGAANPTAKVELAAVNGSAATFMRSDASPPIDQGITPTWTGVHLFSGGIKGLLTLAAPASGTTLIVDGADTSPIVNVLGATGKYAVVTIQDGQTGTKQWALISGFPTPGVFSIYDWTGSATRLSISATGAITVAGTFAINGGTPTAAPGGFGSPSGTVTSGLTSSATLAQTAGTLAALLAYLKTIGVIAA